MTLYKINPLRIEKIPLKFGPKFPTPSRLNQELICCILHVPFDVKVKRGLQCDSRIH